MLPKQKYYSASIKRIMDFLDTDNSYGKEFNKLKDEPTKESFIHILLGIQKYLKKHYHFDVDWQKDGEYIIPNITDSLFLDVTGNTTNCTHYDDKYIDGFLFLDSAGELTSADDTEGIADIIIYQSKSGSSKNKNLKQDVVSLISGIEYVFNSGNSENNDLSVYNNAHKAIIYNDLMVHPLYIALNQKFDLSKIKFNLEGTFIDQKDNISDDLSEIIFDDKAVNEQLIQQTSTADLTCASLENHSYPGSDMHVYIAFVYLREYLHFLNYHRSGNEHYSLDEGLFLKNVRSNAGKNTMLNKEIRQTFLDGPTAISGDIWWRSNGISIVADSLINKDQNTFTLKNPSIINGQQTSRQLVNAYLDNEELFNKNNPTYSPWKFMVKIFIADSSKKIVSENIDAIISGLNSQSAINKNSINLINAETKEIADYVEDRKRPVEYHLEIRPGAYSNNDFYKDHDKKSTIITIENLIQYALTAEIVESDSSKTIPIGKIRSSKNTIVRDHYKVISTNTFAPSFWYNFIKAIKDFDDHLEFDDSDKKSGLQYLKFALFRLAYRNYKANCTPYINTEIDSSKLDLSLTRRALTSLKQKLNTAMLEKENKSDVTINWDQYSKRKDFEEMLNNIK